MIRFQHKFDSTFTRMRFQNVPSVSLFLSPTPSPDHYLSLSHTHTLQVYSNMIFWRLSKRRPDQPSSGSTEAPPQDTPDSESSFRKLSTLFRVRSGRESFTTLQINDHFDGNSPVHAAAARAMTCTPMVTRTQSDGVGVHDTLQVHVVDLDDIGSRDSTQHWQPPGDESRAPPRLPLEVKSPPLEEPDLKQESTPRFETTKEAPSESKYQPPTNLMSSNLVYSIRGVGEERDSTVHQVSLGRNRVPF